MNDAPRFGRLILFRYKNGHLNMIVEKELNGPPYGMISYQGKLLVAIGNTVRKYIFLNFIKLKFRFDYLNFHQKILN
jgi:hypothetical protein